MTAPANLSPYGFKSIGLPLPVMFSSTAPVAARPILVKLSATRHQQAQATAVALRTVNKEKLRLFQRGTRLVRRIQNPAQANQRLEDITTPDMLAMELAQMLTFEQEGRELEGPPMTLVKHLLSMETEAWELPRLERVVDIPFFNGQGTLVQDNGYHPEAAIWLDTGALKVTPVSDTPSASELEKAQALLDELLQDFPFDSPASKANAVAAILTPHLRQLISGPVPFALLSASMPGSGKTLLAQLVAALASREPVGLYPEVRGDDEWRKRLLGILRGSPPVVIFDNINSALDSGVLANVLTSGVFQDRALGSNRTESHLNRSLFMFTANNPSVSPELTRRASLIRLNAKVARPQNRAFSCPDLLALVQAERAEYLWAIFTLIQGWLASGKPQGTVTEGGMRAYCQVVGGFTEAFGYGPVLANAADLTEQAGHEQEELLALIHAWAARFGTDTVTAKQLAQLIADEGLVFDGLTTLHHTGVGKLVKRHRDAVLGGYQVRVTPDPSNKRSVYSLEEPSV